MPEEEKPNEEVQQEKTDGWDKDRQRIDQLSANVTKIANEKAEVDGQLKEFAKSAQETQETVVRLTEQLANARTVQVESESLDTDMYDDKLIKKIDALEASEANNVKLRAEDRALIKELVDDRDKYVQDAANQKEADRKAECKESILSGLDKDYGAKFRNEALKLAQEEVNQTGVSPDGDLAVYKLLEKHYKLLSAKPGTSKSFTQIPADNGEGGVVFGEDEIEEGSRDEVMASIRAKFKGKPFTMPKV